MNIRRTSMIAGLAGLVLWTAQTTRTLGATPTGEQIKCAVANLGAPDFKTREQATRLLWEAGAAAESALQKARNDPDPEVSHRARQLLQDIEYGIQPDTPDNIRALILRYPDSQALARQEIVEQLADAGPSAHRALGALARTESDYERRVYIFWPLVERTTRMVREAVERAQPTREELDDAIRYARLCMDIFPEDISPVLELVIRLGDLDQNEQANRLFDAIVQHYEKHLAVSPEDADALNNIAWLCALTRQHLDRAVVYAEKATKLQPNTSAYLDTLAEIQFQRGHPERAIKLMRQCIKLDAHIEYYKAQLKRFESRDTKSRPPLSLAPLPGD